MKRHVMLGALALGFAALAIGCEDDDPTGPATETFQAALNGLKERPTPRTTPAVGTADFTLRNDTLRWTVAMTNLANITAGHIHIGGPEESREIILFLTGAAGSFTNSLITGFTTRSTFPTPNPPHQAVTFDSLLVLMRTGGSYVNLHTNNGVAPTNEGPGDFPAGEIRGQVNRVP